MDGRCASSSSISCPPERPATCSFRWTPPCAGAGTGPEGGDAEYPQNRASLHLHGGLTPWISGGSQYQWISPAGEKSPYRSGPSLVNVPDMWFDAQGRPVDEGTPGATNDPGPDATTLYFPNDQSARLLYLHDDTYGLTRLSVYAGEAAPYVIDDDVEDELVHGNAGESAGNRAIDAPVQAGTVPAAELPLIIEDKTFVPGAEQLRITDPTWDLARWGGLGALWYPHVYMPNQTGVTREGSVSDQDIINAKGRWDYLPWYWAGYDGTENGPVANPLYGAGAPAQGEPRHAQSLRGDQRVPRHDARQRHRVSLPAGRAQGLSAADPQRLRRPPAEPAAVLRDLQRDREDGRGRRARAADRLGRRRPCCPPSRRSSGGWPARWPTDTRRGRRAGPARGRPGDDPDRQRRRPPAAHGDA